MATINRGPPIEPSSAGVIAVLGICAVAAVILGSLLAPNSVDDGVSEPAPHSLAAPTTTAAPPPAPALEPQAGKLSPAAAGLAVVLTLLAVAMAAIGYMSIDGQYDSLLRAARRVTGQADAGGQRNGPGHGQVRVVLTSPAVNGQEADSWLIVLDADDTDIYPKTMLVRATDYPIECQFEVRAETAARINVGIAVFDVATLTPLAQLTATVPASAPDGLVARLLARVRYR